MYVGASSFNVNNKIDIYPRKAGYTEIDWILDKHQDSLVQLPIRAIFLGGNLVKSASDRRHNHSTYYFVDYFVNLQ